MAARIYRPADLERLGITYTQQYLRVLEKAGRFPRRFKLNPDSGTQGAIGWNAAAVDAWIEEVTRQGEAA